MTSLREALTSSIGKKILMGLTGLLLVGFLVEHLLGNLKLLEDPSGQAFDEYVRFMQGFGPLLYVAEIGLGLLFLAHVYLAFRLTLENIQARKQRYVVRGSRGSSSVGSVSMFFTGALLLGYLLKHLLDFRFNADYVHAAAPHEVVQSKLAQGGHAAVYIVAILALGVHLSHGFRSALQSLGVNHPRWNPALERLGKVIACLFALGFVAIPLYFLFRNSGPQ